MHTWGRRDQHIRKTLLRVSKKLTRIPTRNQDFCLFSKMPTAEFTSWGLSAHLFEAPQLLPKTQGFHRGCAIRDESPRHFITSPSPHVPTRNPRPDLREREPASRRCIVLGPLLALSQKRLERKSYFCWNFPGLLGGVLTSQKKRTWEHDCSSFFSCRRTENGCSPVCFLVTKILPPAHSSEVETVSVLMFCKTERATTDHGHR